MLRLQETVAVNAMSDDDQDDATLLAALADCRGSHGANEQARSQRCRGSRPLPAIGRSIAPRDSIVLQPQGRLVSPAFDLRRSGLDTLPVFQLVLDELSGVLDADERAQWFFRPNAWLDGCMPACAIHGRADAVHRAARADRWAMRG